MRTSAGPRRPLLLTQEVYDAIKNTIGEMPAEQGGALGGPAGDEVVDSFRFDGTARRTGATYSPDDALLNRLFAGDWNPRGVRLRGFVHSHPPGILTPSRGDVMYARAILNAIPDLRELQLPIVQTRPDTGQFEIHPFAVRLHEDGRVLVEPRGIWLQEEAPVELVHEHVPEAFRRVEGAYDLRRMRRTRIIAIGVGGAASCLEDLARAGIGEFVLIDPDRVSETNLATQQTYRRDVGRLKVNVLAERLAQINQSAIIHSKPHELDDYDDAEIRELAHGSFGRGTPEITLICGFTDAFGPQARVNRLALKLGVPSLCAQVYEHGLGAEVTFTYPGVTPACHRCALRPRYVAYIDEGYENDVTSTASPIFSTTRLNALKGFVALALIHHGTGHARWGQLLRRIGNRNLIQIRMHPDVPLRVFDRVFSGSDVDRILFDETVWLPQLPDCPATGLPPCPDCGGTGDLRSQVGTLKDTRLVLS